MRRRLYALLILVAVAVLISGVASADGPLSATVIGPTAVAPGQKALYNVTVSGGPTTNVSYSVTYYVRGTNTTGAAPVASTPGRVTGNGTAFRINITAPQAEQDIALVVTVEATPRGRPAENFTTNYAIIVIRPLVLSGRFHNSASTAALNVTVRWYVDDRLVGTSFISQIAANGDATATFNYLPVGLAAGEHSVRVEADLDHDGVINPARGEVSTSAIFYKQVQALSVGWTALLGIGVFVLVLFAVVAVRRRSTR